MKLPKKFKSLNEKDRMKYAMKKKQEYEKKADFWTEICRKLATNKDFTPLEMDIVDAILDKEIPQVQNLSNVKFKEGKIIEKLKSE